MQQETSEAILPGAQDKDLRRLLRD